MDSEPDNNLNMDLNAKKRKANKRQNKDVNMRDDSNLNKNVEQKEGDTETKLYKYPKRTKKGVCVKCNRTMIMFPNSLCKTCYDKHLKAKREKEGRQKSKLLIICLKCNLLKRHYARQLCSSCYDSVKKSKKKLKKYSLSRTQSHFGKQGICIKCNESKVLFERFMCSVCYERDKKAKLEAGAQKCGNCGKLELLELNGFCSECNSDKRIRKMADRSNLIGQDLNRILRTIQENELVSSAHLAVHSSLSPYATYFEQFSKIKFSFLHFVGLDDSNDQIELKADLKEENVGSSKYSIRNEDFIGRLKQYTQSKLKPLKKQSKPLNTENASSIFNVAKEEKLKISKPMNVNLKECTDCKQMKLHCARGRCRLCYQRFMRQKKKEDAEKAKIIEQTKEKSSQNVEIQESNADKEEVSSGKPKRKRAKNQSSDA